MILDDIVKKKQSQLEMLLQRQLPRKMGPIAQKMKDMQDLFVIGEIKKASPSKGMIVDDFQPANLAKEYTKADVQAISVLTEENYFLGSLDYISIVKQHTTLPVLRKDFLIDPREIIQSYIAGANLILLIVAILSDEQLALYYKMASMLKMECIVEVHNEAELQRALIIEPEIIGINHRDLYTFEVDLSLTQRLRGLIPSTTAVIAESGIFTHEDMQRVCEAGADGVLIGESFMRSGDKKKHLEQLRYGTH